MPTAPPPEGRLANFRPSALKAPIDSSNPAKNDCVVVKDIFEQVLNDKYITLVDWEGYIANPAIRLSFSPSSNAKPPVQVMISSRNPRLYFDLPSENGPYGATKDIDMEDSAVPIYVSIFPDRDGQNETEHTLQIKGTDAAGRTCSQTIPIFVIDQDSEVSPSCVPCINRRNPFPYLSHPYPYPYTDRQESLLYLSKPQPLERPLPFTISIDFSKDESGMFEDPAKQTPIKLAALDWAYFFADQETLPVVEGDETTSFLPANEPGWGEAKAYYAEHVPEIDPASQRGAYGTQKGIMPHRRWLITKLDLLIAQAVGYKLRKTSAFIPLTVTQKELRRATLGQDYSDLLLATGGIPAYHWKVIAGRLPRGLSLDSFSGTLAGVALEQGVFNFIIQLRDNQAQYPLGQPFATQLYVSR